jgi:hypothetical protein
MEKNSYDNRIEQDIARCNQDISNSAGEKTKQNSKSPPRVMPAFEDILKNKATQSHPPVQSAGEKEFVRKMVEKISHPQQQDRSSQIPSLDLGQQILAQQRKIAALKRKSPGPLGDALRQQEIKPQLIQIKSMPQAPASPQQRIIADIVAKEILALTGVR